MFKRVPQESKVIVRYSTWQLQSVIPEVAKNIDVFKNAFALKTQPVKNILSQNLIYTALFSIL